MVQCATHAGAFISSGVDREYSNVAVAQSQQNRLGSTFAVSSCKAFSWPLWIIPCLSIWSVTTSERGEPTIAPPYREAARDTGREPPDTAERRSGGVVGGALATASDRNFVRAFSHVMRISSYPRASQGQVRRRLHCPFLPSRPARDGFSSKHMSHMMPLNPHSSRNDRDTAFRARDSTVSRHADLSFPSTVWCGPRQNSRMWGVSIEARGTARLCSRLRPPSGCPAAPHDRAAPHPPASCPSA